MEVEPANGPQNLVKADIVESLKTCVIEYPKPMIWDYELRPMLQIYRTSRAPVRVLSEEGVFPAYDLAFKVGCKVYVVFGQAYEDFRPQLARCLSQMGFSTCDSLILTCLILTWMSNTSHSDC